MGLKPAKKKKPTQFAKRKLGIDCDVAFGKLVRARGECEAKTASTCTPHARLQCAHGFSRSYHAVRWDDRNAFALCAACHVYYTHRPEEWRIWMENKMGTALFAEVLALALTHRSPDVAELRVTLEARVEALGLS